MKLERLVGIDDKKYFVILDSLKRKYKLSRKTLFYVKEYRHKDVFATIMRESLIILIATSLISSIGGLFIEEVKSTFITFLPLIVMFPILNDMVGDYSSIISSRLSSILHKRGAIRKWNNKDIRDLYLQVMTVALVLSLLAGVFAVGITYFYNSRFDFYTTVKLILIPVVDVVVFVSFLFAFGILVGVYSYKKNYDPTNLLVPLLTSLADLGNMVFLVTLSVILL